MCWICAHIHLYNSHFDECMTVSMYWRWQKVLSIVLCNCAHTDDGPVRPETCGNLSILIYAYDLNEVYAFVGLYFKTCVQNFTVERLCRYHYFFL